MFRAFDFAIPDQCAERRPRTTVPQQALFAMNSPFVLEQARAVTTLPEIIRTAEPEQRVEALFGRVLGRLPTEREVNSSIRFVHNAERESLPENGLTAFLEALADTPSFTAGATKTPRHHLGVVGRLRPRRLVG